MFAAEGWIKDVGLSKFQQEIISFDNEIESSENAGKENKAYGAEGGSCGT